MKKLLAIVLCTVLLCACGAPAVENPETPAAPQYDYDYLVGFGRRDITPKESVPLAGYGFTSNRMSQYVLDELYTSAVAVTDRWGESMILISTDLINANTTVVNTAKQKIFDAIGLPEANIMFCYTHTHSAPDQSNTSATEYMKTYLQEVADAVSKAAISAWENREKAVMYTSSAMTEGLNFVRHYLREDGTYTGPGFGSGSSPLVAHAGEPDREVRLIRFDLESGKDIVMMNWQAHAVMNSHDVSSNKEVSADYVTGIRAHMEQTYGCNFIYFQGAAGDLMPTSQIAGETPTKNAGEFGKMMGVYVEQALAAEQKQEAGPIRVYPFTFDVRVNHDDEHLYGAARQVQEYINVNGSSGVAAFAHSLGLISRHHASSIVSNAALGETIERKYGVFAIGDVGFANAPHELFSDTGIAIREGSPFDMTFILGYSNQSCGYVPIERAYDYRAYEVACTDYARGSAEELAQVFTAQWQNLK